MKWPTDKRLVFAAFWVALALLMTISIATHQSTVRLVTTGGRIERTRVVSDNLQQLLFGLQGAEAGARGLIRTGSQPYRRQRQEALARIGDTLRRLYELASNDWAQRGDLDALSGLLDNHQRLYEEALMLAPQQGSAAALRLLDSERSRSVTDQIRDSVEQLQDKEHRALLRRDEQMRLQADANIAVFVVGSFVSLAVLLSVFLYLNVQVTARDLAERALAEEKQRLEQQYRREIALAEIELAINQPQELRRVLEQIAHAVTDLLPATSASIILWDPGAEEFVTSASTVPGQRSSTGKDRARKTGGATRWIVDHKQPLVVPDIRGDPFGANPMLTERSFQSYAGVPLLVEGEALGVVYALDRQVREYRPDELKFLNALAARAALAIVKVRLYDQLQQANRQLEDRVAQRTAALSLSNEQLLREIADHQRAEEAVHVLSGRLLQMQDDERRRIARELHDITAQNVSAVTLNLARLEKLLPTDDERLRKIVAESLALSEESLREIRTLSYLLHPPMLDESGLVVALEWYLDGFAKRSGLQVNLVAPPELGRLPVEAETALFRVVQESLTNIHRHSGSPTAAVELRRNTKTVTLEVQDKGSGLPAAEPAGDATGVGIRGMRERLRQVGGRLEIDSGPHGTVVRAVLPLGGNAA